MNRRAALLLMLLLPALPCRPDRPVQVALSASATTVTIGERVDLRVVARAGAGVTAMRVAVPAGDYEVLSRRALPAADAAGGRTFAEIVTVAFFRTGDFVVGPFPVELLAAGGRAAASEETGRLALRVRSLLGENDRDIKPLKEPLPLRGDPRRLWPVPAFFLLLLLLAALAAFARKRARSRRAGGEASAPQAPADAELEESLRRLRRSELLRRGEFRAFFIALTAALRRFLGRAYGFPAEERTTAETLALLGEREGDAALVAGLETVLAQADLAKFARRPPAGGEMDALWTILAGLVAAHRARREKAQEAADAQAGR
jgi:hypothetical protein